MCVRLLTLRRSEGLCSLSCCLLRSEPRQQPGPQWTTLCSGRCRSRSKSRASSTRSGRRWLRTMTRWPSYLQQQRKYGGFTILIYKCYVLTPAGRHIAAGRLCFPEHLEDGAPALAGQVCPAHSTNTSQCIALPISLVLLPTCLLAEQRQPAIQAVDIQGQRAARVAALCLVRQPLSSGEGPSAPECDTFLPCSCSRGTA